MDTGANCGSEEGSADFCCGAPCSVTDLVAEESAGNTSKNGSTTGSTFDGDIAQGGDLAIFNSLGQSDFGLVVGVVGERLLCAGGEKNGGG